MARDYKHVAEGKVQPKRSREWPFFTLGLALGLFVAAIVYLKERTPHTVQLQAVQEIASEVDARAAQNEESAPLLAPPKPRFDFYTILPEMEVKVQDWEI
ncbi:MAG: hypothetical protein L0Y67_06770 [Gammaproteobacteria bacterium]|nr:hypothetical protein [Gammaproteobacteria bacterium]